jgi:hypothetical protein
VVTTDLLIEANVKREVDDHGVTPVPDTISKVSIEKLWHVLGKYLGKNVSGKENDRNLLSVLMEPGENQWLQYVAEHITEDDINVRARFLLRSNLVPSLIHPYDAVLMVRENKAVSYDFGDGYEDKKKSLTSNTSDSNITVETNQNSQIIKDKKSKYVLDITFEDTQKQMHVYLNGSTVTQMSVIEQENSSPPELVQDSTVLATGNISQKAKEEIEKFISVADNFKLPLKTLAGTVDIQDYSTTTFVGKYWNQEIISKFRSLGLNLIEESRGKGVESNYYGIKNVEDMTIGVQLRITNAQLSEYFVFWLPTKDLPANIDEVRASSDSLKKYVNDAGRTDIIIKTSGGQRKKSQKRNKKRSRQTQKGNRNAK